MQFVAQVDKVTFVSDLVLIKKYEFSPPGLEGVGREGLRCAPPVVSRLGAQALRSASHLSPLMLLAES